MPAGHHGLQMGRDFSSRGGEIKMGEGEKDHRASQDVVGDANHRQAVDSQEPFWRPFGKQHEESGGDQHRQDGEHLSCCGGHGNCCR